MKNVQSDYIQDCILDALHDMGISPKHQELETGVTITLNFDVLSKISNSLVDAIDGIIYSAHESNIEHKSSVNHYSENIRLIERINTLEKELGLYHQAELAIKEEAGYLNEDGRAARKALRMISQGKKGECVSY